MTTLQNNKENTVEETVKEFEKNFKAIYGHSFPNIANTLKSLLKEALLSYGQSMKEEGKREAYESFQKIVQEHSDDCFPYGETVCTCHYSLKDISFSLGKPWEKD